MNELDAIDIEILRLLQQDGRISNAELAQRVHSPEFDEAKPERIFVIDVLSYDWNCPKFITPRYTSEEVETAVEPLRRRIAELEQQLGERSK